MNFVRKYFLILILTAIATVLVFFWAQSRSPKPKEEGVEVLPKIPFPTLVGQEILPQTTVELTAGNTPTKTNVYQIEPLTATDEQVVVIAASLGFPEQPASKTLDVVYGPVYLWLAEKQSLTIRLSPLEISTATESSLFPPPTEGALPSQEQVVNTAKALVSKIGLGRMQFTPSTIKTTPDGNLVEGGLIPTIEGIPVVDVGAGAPLVLVRIRKDGSVDSFIWRLGFSNPKNKLTYLTKSTQQIKDALAKEGKIMLLGPPSQIPITTIPTKIVISQVTNVLMFLPERPTILFPVYVLSGTATTEQGELPVVIYMPSVRSAYIDNR